MLQLIKSMLINIKLLQEFKNLTTLNLKTVHVAYIFYLFSNIEKSLFFEFSEMVPQM